MRNARTIFTGIIIAFIGILAGCSSKPSTQLVSAWQLFPVEGYRGVMVKDPFVSWSPDSKSLLVSGVTFKNLEHFIMKWNVGDRKLEKVGEGLTPSYISSDEFIFFRSDPKGIFLQNLKTGEKREIMADVKKSTFWSETEGINYDPESELVSLRLVGYTPRYLRGTDQYGLDGKPVVVDSEDMGPDVLEYSADATGTKSALLVQEGTSQPVLLEIADRGKDRGKQIAEGSMVGVAWSPAGDIIAYGESKEVLVTNSAGDKQVVVARFGKKEATQDRSAVSRLSWSPDGKYLAVLYYVSSDAGDFPLLYVLDMQDFEWGR